MEDILPLSIVYVRSIPIATSNIVAVGLHCCDRPKMFLVYLQQKWHYRCTKLPIASEFKKILNFYDDERRLIKQKNFVLY